MSQQSQGIISKAAPSRSPPAPSSSTVIIPTSKKGFPTWAKIASAIAGVVIFALIIFGIVQATKPSNESPPRPPGGEEPVDEEPPISDEPPYPGEECPRTVTGPAGAVYCGGVFSHKRLRSAVGLFARDLGGDAVQMQQDDPNQPAQFWSISNGINLTNDATGQCLCSTCGNSPGGGLYAGPCDANNPGHRWLFDPISNALYTERSLQNGDPEFLGPNEPDTHLWVFNYSAANAQPIAVVN